MRSLLLLLKRRRQPPVNSVLPAISGTAAQGQTLSASTGTWSGSPTYAYQWKRGGVNIGSATNSTYVVQAADLGTTITVTVTATNAAGSASATSAGQAIASMADPVAYYQLESSGADATGRGNDLSPTNAPTYTTGKLGNAVSLVAASTQYLSRASTADLSMGSNQLFTLCGWCKFTTTGNRSLWGKFNIGGTNQREYQVLIEGGTFKFSVSQTGSGVTASVTTGTPATGTWYFLAAWYDGTNLNLSVNNGTVAQAAYSAGVNSNNSPFYIGSIQFAGYYMDGLIDGVGVWRRVLTPTEITALYNSGNGIAYPF